MLQRYDVRGDQLSAKLLCMSNSPFQALHAFGSIVQGLANIPDDVAVTEEALLKALRLSTVTYNSQNVITGIFR